MMLSTVVVTMFLIRVSSFDSYELTSISALAWWFVLGLFPLYFVSGLFMLWGNNWARELCVAVGTSAVLFGFVVLPFTVVIAGAALFVLVAAVLLYHPRTTLFFAQPDRARRPLSLVSFLVGAVAAAMAATAAYLRSVHVPGSGASLNWLTKMGLVKQPSAGEASLTEASIFAVNDENALVFLTSLALVLAATAMVIALIAELRREPTLYLSAGFICGAVAILLFKLLIGLATMMVGIVALLVLRHDRRSHEDT
jgi:hypothetical protein